tara:strand:+ start:610 stop:1056 length:447 start_codon:yes stop_codon:yes gene_type:complete
MCEDPDSILTHRLDTRRAIDELELHLFELAQDLQILARLDRLLFSPPRGTGKSLRARRLSALFASSAADGLDNLWLCGRVVYYDEIQPDFDDNERIEYLKRITMEEPKKPPRVRACRRPRKSDRAARDAARRGHERRERGTRPTRARR